MSCPSVILLSFFGFPFVTYLWYRGGSSHCHTVEEVLGMAGKHRALHSKALEVAL